MTGAQAPDALVVENKPVIARSPLSLQVLAATQLLANPQLAAKLEPIDKERIGDIYKKDLFPVITQEYLSPFFLGSAFIITQQDLKIPRNPIIYTNNLGSYYLTFTQKTVLRFNTKLQEFRSFDLLVNKHAEAIVAVSDDGNYCLLSSGSTATLLFLNTKTSNAEKVCELPIKAENDTKITSLAFSPSSRVFAIGYADGKVLVFNNRTITNQFDLKTMVAALVMPQEDVVLAATDNMAILGCKDNGVVTVKGVGKKIRKLIFYNKLGQNEKRSQSPLPSEDANVPVAEHTAEQVQQLKATAAIKLQQSINHKGIVLILEDSTIVVYNKFLDKFINTSIKSDNITILDNQILGVIDIDSTENKREANLQLYSLDLLMLQQKLEYEREVIIHQKDSRKEQSAYLRDLLFDYEKEETALSIQIQEISPLLATIPLLSCNNSAKFFLLPNQATVIIMAQRTYSDPAPRYVPVPMGVGTINQAASQVNKKIDIIMAKEILSLAQQCTIEASAVVAHCFPYQNGAQTMPLNQFLRCQQIVEQQKGKIAPILVKLLKNVQLDPVKKAQESTSVSQKTTQVSQGVMDNCIKVLCNFLGIN